MDVLDSATLRELQLNELEILLEIDQICRKHNLIYQLYSGTLLGAIRHKGFIPWDDDIDICMLRKDYTKLLNILESELDKNFFLQTHNTDKYYPHSFARIRKNNTVMLQEIWSDVEMHHGIFIDIFPLDKVDPDSIKGKLQRKLIYLIRRIKFLAKHKTEDSVYWYRKQIRKIFHFFFKPISIQKFNDFETKIAKIFENEDTLYSTHLSEGSNIYYEKYLVKNDDFYHTIDMEFEGYLFPVPIKYDEVLTDNFGDYLTPPPLESQIPHHGIIQICFDSSSTAEQ